MRAHRVITNGGDQPNVVPRNASVWYFFRELDYPNVMNMWTIGDNMAKAAALMTDTTMSSRVLGSAWPQHMNKVVAETAYANILKVGMPQWTEADQTLAKAVQKELGVEQRGLPTEVPKLNGRVVVPDDEKRGGGSDDIGDISWNVPTVTLRYPANICGFSSVRIRRLPSAATSPTSSRRRLRFGTFSARPTTRISSGCGTSATAWPRAPL